MRKKRRLTPDEIDHKRSGNRMALMKEYSGTTICIPELNKWDYAIPGNYTDYQDGFLWEDCEPYRGKPLIEDPVHGILYLRWEVRMYMLRDGEKEKYLCFDRHGNKYTVIIQECPEMEGGNPSYFRFLTRVKKYTPKRKTTKSKG